MPHIGRNSISLGFRAASANDDLVVGRARAWIGPVDNDFCDIGLGLREGGRGRAASPPAIATPATIIRVVNFVITCPSKAYSGPRFLWFLIGASKAQSPPCNRLGSPQSEPDSRLPLLLLLRELYRDVQPLQAESPQYLWQVRGLDLPVPRAERRMASISVSIASVQASAAFSETSAVIAPSAYPATFQIG